MRLSRSRVTDGEWHHLLIELKSAKEGKDIKYLAVMTLDYGMDQVSWHLCAPFGTGPFVGPTENRVTPPRARTCRSPGGFWDTRSGPAEFGSHILPYAAVTSVCASSPCQMASSWTQELDLIRLLSHRGAVGTGSSGPFQQS